mgnify:FL=1
MASTLTTTVDGAVGRITLDRPDSLNPLSFATLDELAAAASWFDERPEIRVVVVAGRGRAFCAGMDLGAFSGRPDREPREGAEAGRRMVESIESMAAATIAAVHGHCVGGGVLLATACDLRVAAAGTRFVIPEIDLGIPLAWGGIPRLVREVGPAVARDLVLSCRPFDAAEALALGVVNRVVDDTALAAEVDTLAESLAAKSTFTVRATLTAIDAAAEGLVSTAGAAADADLLAAALADPESRAVGRRYLRDRQP